MHPSKPVGLHQVSGVLLIIILGLTTSCGNIKQLQYLQGTIDTAAIANINFIEPTIQKGDILSVTVFSDNPLASAIYNQAAAASPTAQAAGYLVSQDGYIQLHALGLVKALGLTKKQLADILVQQYIEKNLLQNPFVEVRFLNFKITVIGDVNGPGVFTFPSEKVSIFDAIGEAGDLTVYAKRDNVLVVREVNGVRRFARLDLTNPNVFNSPFFFLQQNDMVVVDPTRVKATTTDQTIRNLSIITSLISLAAIVISLFQ